MQKFELDAHFASSMLGNQQVPCTQGKQHWFFNKGSGGNIFSILDKDKKNSKQKGLIESMGNFVRVPAASWLNLLENFYSALRLLQMSFYGLVVNF